MAMDYDLENIRDEFRTLTGRLSTGQLSDADCLLEINKYYQHHLPFEINCHEFDAWTTFDTVDGTESYAIPSTVLSVEPPVTAKDSDDEIYPVSLYTDQALWKADYPDDEHDEADEENRPESALIFSRYIYLRPVPDAVYEIEYKSRSQYPTAFAQDTDVPDDLMWWKLIAVGAARLFLATNGEHDEAMALKGLHEYEINQIARKQILQRPIGTRALPRW